MAATSVLIGGEASSSPVFKVPALFEPSTLTNDHCVNSAITPIDLIIGDDPDQLVHDFTANMNSGVFQIRGAPQAPFESIAQLFKKIEQNPGLASRANSAYNKIWCTRTRTASVKGEKKVIDLSPSRLDSSLAKEFGAPLDNCLSFFDSVKTEIAPKILKALAKVTGNEGIMLDNMVNYRMVDYPARPSKASWHESEHGPRCGAHRDFGTFTLIFPDGVAGLEIQLSDDNIWRPLSVSPGSAVLMFGWCAAIRANDRVPAILHRVADVKENSDGNVPRRMSAVFFLAPSADTILEPKLLHKDEFPIYRSITAMEFKNNIGRKWRYREGTLTDRQDIEMEEVENKTFSTQDDVVEHLFKN